MKALVKRKSEPGLWLEDVPEPKIGLNDVLIRVDRTGICGTDLHIYKWDAWAQKTIPVPMVVGHEFVGEIVEVGSNVKDFFPGQVVSGEGHVVCGRCRNCLAGRRHLCADTKGVGVNRPGAFAEYLSLPMSNVWVHAPGIDPDVASIFDPFGNAVHTALSFPVLGEDVLVTGAGPIGIMAAAVARHAGARYVVIGIEGETEHHGQGFKKLGLLVLGKLAQHATAHQPQKFGDEHRFLFRSGFALLVFIHLNARGQLRAFPDGGQLQELDHRHAWFGFAIHDLVDVRGGNKKLTGGFRLIPPEQFHYFHELGGQRTHFCSHNNLLS